MFTNYPRFCPPRWVTSECPQDRRIALLPAVNAGPAKPRWVLRITLALLALTAGAVAAASAWYRWPAPRAEVRTLIHVPPSRPWVLRMAGGVPDLGNHQRVQVALMKNRLVLKAILNDEKVRGLPVVAQQVDPVQWLEEEVQVDFSVAPRLMRVAMTGDRADDLMIMVKTLQEMYLREVVEREANQRRERLTTLRRLREKYEGKLRAFRETQKATQQKGGAKDAGVQALILGLLRQQMDEAVREELQAKTDLEKAKLQVAAEEAQEMKLDDFPIRPGRVDAEVDQQPAVKELLQKVEELRQAVTVNVKADAQGGQGPAVKGLKDELKAAEEALYALRAKLRPEALWGLRARVRAELGASILVLQSRVEVLEESVTFFESETERLRDLIQEKAGTGAVLDAFRENFSRLEEMTKQFAAEEVALQVVLNAPTREHVIESAVVGLHPARKAERRRAAALTGLAFAFVPLAFACLFLRVRVSFRVSDLT